MTWGKRGKRGWSGEGEAGERLVSFTGIIKTILEVVPGGVIRAGKTAYSDDASVGFWLGVDTDGLAKLNLGGVDHFLKWTGTELLQRGDLSFLAPAVSTMASAIKWLHGTQVIAYLSAWYNTYGASVRLKADAGANDVTVTIGATSDGELHKGRIYLLAEGGLNTAEVTVEADATSARARFGVDELSVPYGDILVGATGAVKVGSDACWHAGNDGSTSGLDADLLDGQHASDFAAAGHTHAGIGDVAGPASAVDDRIATFDGVTGKLLQDGGSKISDLAVAGHSHTVGGVVPVGGIIMWSGTVATIPTNWALCDGGSSTPDLRDRFVVGARQDDAGVAKTNVTGSLTQAGGAIAHHHADHTFTQPGDHSALSHSGGAVDAHAGTAVDAHAGTAVANHAAGTTGQAGAGATQRGSTASTLTLATHTHSTPALTHTVTQPNNHVVTQPNDHTFTQPSSHTVSAHSGGSVDAHDTLSAAQPYFALAFIMRTA